MDRNLPLYKRATSIMHLKNFDFVTSYKYLKISICDAIKVYSIFGGSPQFYRYFSLNRIKNVEGMIKSIFLNSNSIYVFEPRDFITDEFGRRSQTYFSILYSISTGNTKVSDIANITDVKATSMQPYLFEMKDILNLITYELPVTHKNNKIDKKGIYKLTDNYMEFWFSQFYPNINQFELGNYSGVVNSLIQSVDMIVPHKFEEICKELMIYMNNEKVDILPFSIQKIGKWWGRNTNNNRDRDQEEIDIIALNEEKKAIMFGECKWTHRPVGVSVYEDLKRKSMNVELNNKDRNDYFILFSKSGFTDKMRDIAEKDNVLLFDLDKIEGILKK
jgi:AAA+ ATPase superfamily predicted ATPase